MHNNKKNITRWLENMILCSRGKSNISPTRSRRSLVRYCFCHSNIKFISSRVISSIYFLISMCMFVLQKVLVCRLVEACLTLRQQAEGLIPIILQEFSKRSIFRRCVTIHHEFQKFCKSRLNFSDQFPIIFEDYRFRSSFFE